MVVPFQELLLMEEILHQLGCINPCKYSNGINYISTGAGFLPSAVCFTSGVKSISLLVLTLPVWKAIQAL